MSDITPAASVSSIPATLTFPSGNVRVLSAVSARRLLSGLHRDLRVEPEVANWMAASPYSAQGTFVGVSADADGRRVLYFSRGDGSAEDVERLTADEAVAFRAKAVAVLGYDITESDYDQVRWER